MTKKRRPKKKMDETPRDKVKVTVGEIDLESFMALINCATLGSAVVLAKVKDADETFMHNLYRMASAGLVVVGPDRWNTLMMRLGTLGNDAIAAAGIHSVKGRVEILEAEDPHVPRDVQ